MKNWYRPFSLLVLVFILACGGLTNPEPTATATVVDPTETEPPTSTPVPTETSTPPPTSTPDVTATAAVQATEGATTVLTELDNLLKDTEIPYEQGNLLWQQTKPLSVEMSGPAEQNLLLSDVPSVGNFILKSDVTWKATGLIVCGAIFRAEDDLKRGQHYWFGFLRFSGAPVWEIDFVEFGRFKNSISKTQSSVALDQANNATNQFVLIAQDEQFNLYINQHREGRYFDNSKQRLDGLVAFTGLQDSGTGSCTFENSWIWSLDE